jgi:hypothetical protein
MSKQLRLMILLNALFVVLYGFVNWAEYNIININSSLNQTTIQTHFPFYFLVTKFSVGFSSILFLNYPLIIFVVATIANVYFVFRFQTSK